MPGDRVRIEVDANDEGYVQEILPRKNFLVRPPLANLDKLFVVSSVCDPQPSTLIIDKTIAAAELKGIEPVLVFTKTDPKRYDGAERHLRQHRHSVLLRLGGGRRGRGRPAPGAYGLHLRIYG